MEEGMLSNNMGYTVHALASFTEIPRILHHVHASAGPDSVSVLKFYHHVARLCTYTKGSLFPLKT